MDGLLSGFFYNNAINNLRISSENFFGKGLKTPLIIFKHIDPIDSPSNGVFKTHISYKITPSDLKIKI